ncbi:Small-conductance mechanosensitive channel [uncultured Gammaproteobacteria bacterium]
MTHPLRLRRIVLPALLWVGGMAVYALEPKFEGWPDWLPDSVHSNIGLGAGTIGWLALAWLSWRLFDLAVARHDQPVPRLLNDLVRAALLVVATVIILGSVFHQQVTGLVATSGVVVAVLGFALREIMGDIFAGVALSLERPYGLGDWIELDQAGIVGRVIEFNWRATRLQTLDEMVVVVPNGKLARGRFVNYSLPQRHFRATLPVVLDYDVPADRARRILLAAVAGVSGVLRCPAPDVVADQFTDRGLRYVIRFWVSDYEPLTVCRDQVAASVLRNLKLAGITPPHGRQDLTIARAPVAPDPRRRRAILLGCVDLFHILTEADLDELAEGLESRTLYPGVDVVRAGEPGNSLFVIVEGLLEVRAAGATLATLGPGQVFGEMSLLTGQPRSATVTTATDAILFEISTNQLRPILQRQPDLAMALGAILAERQRANLERANAGHDDEVERPNAQSFRSLIRDFFGLGR